jgi:hypothetical protein
LKRAGERACGSFGASFSHAISPYGLSSSITSNFSAGPGRRPLLPSNPKSLASVTLGAVQRLHVLRAGWLADPGIVTGVGRVRIRFYGSFVRAGVAKV